ncbi:Hypothetical predicted protein [Mytilus galloprovincialis]|uniref:Uncharacterized protein n=1 Tax=Mytilus galloprovincialis TaxID=29158 RepID=A0A8B6EBS1_MYTGA|nr:Hypothetical predicted protein [Mytilus galloprovincialis]VDI31743.1 Hypothetical predicted protein [Mytilus galloprovincialis]
MEAFRASRKLRELIVSHDNAARQILILGIKINDLQQRLLKLSRSDLTDTESIMYSLMDQRKSMTEFIHDMYQVYRLIKWQQIQMMVKVLWEGFTPTDINQIIVMAMMQYADSITSDEDGNSSVLEEDMIVEERLQ